MNLKFTKCLVRFLGVFFFFRFLIFSQIPIDLSEKIMKIKGQAPNDFGDIGFGVYDWGEKKYKILNWEFKIIQSFPVAIGEGPGEVKPYIYNSFIYNDKVYINGHLSRSINIYSYKGIFLGSISLNITPRHIILHNKKIYVINSTVIEAGNLPFAHILDIDTGRKLKEIYLKSPLPKPKDLGDTISMYFIHYDIGKDNLIYMLHALENSLIIINEEGNIIKKMKLPHEVHITYTANKDGDNVRVNLNTLDFYHDIKCCNNNIYFAFLKTEKIGDTISDTILKTHLIKWNNGKFKEKIFDGDLIILGEYKNTLYLFNQDDYSALPVDLSSF